MIGHETDWIGVGASNPCCISTFFNGAASTASLKLRIGSTSLASKPRIVT